MAKVANKRMAPTSVKLKSDLKSRIDPVLFLREMSFSELVEKALQEYIQAHPLTKEEQTFWSYRQKKTK